MLPGGSRCMAQAYIADSLAMNRAAVCWVTATWVVVSNRLHAESRLLACAQPQGLSITMSCRCGARAGGGYTAQV